MTVFITQEMRNKDLSNAIAFGDLRIVMPAEQQITSNEIYKKIAINLIEEVLKDFNDDDYLLLSGDPAAIGLCTAVAMLNNNGNVNILKWDRMEEKYYPVNLSVEMGDL